MDKISGHITRHYFQCPHCYNHADLETHHCLNCGAEVLEIVWSMPTRSYLVSPELELINRTNNTGLRFH